MAERDTLVAVFENRMAAEHAVSELKRAGFTDDQIGVMARNAADVEGLSPEAETYAGEGGAAGLVAGAGVGALWGLGIVAGALPAVGPAIAGGTLAAILSSATAGAAAAGLAGTLIGLGVPKHEAEYYESELAAGRIILTVHANGRRAEAMGILRRFGGYDITDRDAGTAPGTTAGAAAGSVGRGAYDVPVVEEDLTDEERVSGTTGAAWPRREDEGVRVPVREEQVTSEPSSVPPLPPVTRPSSGSATPHGAGSNVRTGNIETDEDLDIREPRR